LTLPAGRRKPVIWCEVGRIARWRAVVGFSNACGSARLPPLLDGEEPIRRAQGDRATPDRSPGAVGVRVTPKYGSFSLDSTGRYP
jgi:hypothetical protein